MLRYLYGAELDQHPVLKRSMFQDRARQFKDRMNWDVHVDAFGYERDAYDLPQTLYAIWQCEDGTHGGSMRCLPCNGPIMINDHFSELAGQKLDDPTLFESTRFCLGHRAMERNVCLSSAIMLAGCEIGLGLNLTGAVAVFDERIRRVYTRIGWPPEIINTKGDGRDAISIGRWRFDRSIQQRLAIGAGLSPELSRHWFACASHKGAIAA